MVRVRVSEGILEGEEVENEFGGSYCSFKGVPYAQPPIGELRFKAPQPPKPWSAVRSAKTFGPECPQFDYFTRSLIKRSEDCLYLNIYTPSLNPDKPLPVMFWIHCGGFVWGSGNDDLYGPEFLVRKDVVLVTFNYRLEVLGFLCLDTPEVPGNAGMKDQVAALRWVRKNISNFGGDPENITIFGESAGGASVGYHLISPMSKGLFKRAIVMSGAATCWWSQAFEPYKRAIALAKQLGWESESGQELYEFFKSQSDESLIQKSVPLTLIEQSRVGLHEFFNVVSEKKFEGHEYFFSGNVTDAFRDDVHEKVDVMGGYVEDEALILFGLGLRPDKMIDQAKQYEDYFVPRKINPTPDNTLGVKWSPYTLDQQNYLDIGQELVPGVSPDEEEMRFLDQLWHKYLPQEVEPYYSKLYGE